jgi:glycerate-2-kinase
MILSTRIHGESKHVGRLLGGILVDIADNRLLLSPPAAMVAGGETTVTVTGRGTGGRNPELVLSAALEIDGLANACMTPIGTDGVDGPIDAAGAIADGETIHKARRLKGYKVANQCPTGMI